MDNAREIYKLWWEYLKRSEVYYDYILFSKNNHELLSLHDPSGISESSGFAKNIYSLAHFYKSPDVAFWEDNREKYGLSGVNFHDYLTPKFRNARIVNAIRMYFFVFWDIYEFDFLSRWDSFLEKYVISSENYLKEMDEKSVSCFYEETFDNIVDNCISYFKQKANNYKLDKVLKEYSNELKNHIFSKWSVMMQISTTQNRTTLTNSFKKELIHIEALLENEKNVDQHLCVYPSSTVYIDELKRYLRLYDLKTSKPSHTCRAIYGEIYPDLKKLDAHEMAIGRARASKELGYAKKIIQNVELGLFPGIYAKAKKGLRP